MKVASSLRNLGALRRGARGMASSADLTRMQRFKDHVSALYQQDPVTWSDRTLARHFGVPLDRMQAMLMLQRIEQAEGGVDEADIYRADEAEDLLTPDDVLTGAAAKKRLAALDRALARAQVPTTLMFRMTHEHENTLVTELASRLGVSNLDDADATERLDVAVSGLLAGLSAEQRAELTAVINGEMRTEAEEAKGEPSAKGVASAEEEAPAPAAVSAPAAAAAPMEWPAGLSSAPGGFLAQLVADAGTTAFGGADAAGGSNDVVPSYDTGVIDAHVTVDNPRGLPRFVVKKDVGPGISNYLPQRWLQKLRRIRAIDKSDALATNAVQRHDFLHTDRTFRKKSCDFVFVDAARRKVNPARGKIKVIEHIWVVTSSGAMREPKPDEFRRATLKEKAPQLIPRTQRNWNA